MALSASSSCTTPLLAASEPAKVSTSIQTKSGGVLPLPVKPRFQSSALQRTKSRKPVKGTKPVTPVAAACTATSTDHIPETVISHAVSEADNETSDATDAGPAPAMRVRKSAGKANPKTSRRRALVMCLALGMVRPCASNVETVPSAATSSLDLRRTASAMPALRRMTSTSFKGSSNLVSQVSLATTMKQTNLLGEQEDLQKLTSLQ